MLLVLSSCYNIPKGCQTCTKSSNHFQHPLKKESQEKIFKTVIKAKKSVFTVATAVSSCNFFCCFKVCIKIIKLHIPLLIIILAKYYSTYLALTLLLGKVTLDPGSGNTTSSSL